MDQKNRTPTGRIHRADINASIKQRMGEQAGHISYPQLIHAGLKPDGVRRRVESGLLVLRTEPKPSRRRTPRPAAGPTPPQGRPRPPRKRRASSTQVYSSHAGRLSLDARRWMALLSGPEPSWLGHVTVCELMDLDRPGHGPIHVVHRGGGWNAPKGVVAHKTKFLPESDQAVVNGLRCTTLSRGLLDAAADLGATKLDDYLDTAVRLELYDGDEMLRVLNDRPKLAATTRLTAAIGRLDATSGTFRSNFERRTKRLIERSKRIDQPVVNVLVAGFRPDLWWRGTRAIVECDGRDYHRSPAQIAADEEREAILRARGFVFLRLRWDQVVYDEERTLAMIEAFVLANAA